MQSIHSLLLQPILPFFIYQEHIVLCPNHSHMQRVYLHPRKTNVCLLSAWHSQQDGGCVGGDSVVGWHILVQWWHNHHMWVGEAALAGRYQSLLLTGNALVNATRFCSVAVYLLMLSVRHRGTLHQVGHTPSDNSMNPVHAWRESSSPARCCVALTTPYYGLLRISARLWIMEKGQGRFLTDFYTTRLQLHQQVDRFYYNRCVAASTIALGCCVESLNVALHTRVTSTDHFHELYVQCHDLVLSKEWSDNVFL